MKEMILAGGYGTRLSEETAIRPKPMVESGGRPIIWHIMRSYAAHDIDDFILRCGNRGEALKEYFLDYHRWQSDFTVDVGSGDVTVHRPARGRWRVDRLQQPPDRGTHQRDHVHHRERVEQRRGSQHPPDPTSPASAATRWARVKIRRASSDASNRSRHRTIRSTSTSDGVSNCLRTSTQASTDGGVDRRPVDVNGSANRSSGNNRSRFRCSGPRRCRPGGPCRTAPPAHPTPATPAVSPPTPTSNAHPLQPSPRVFHLFAAGVRATHEEHFPPG